MNSLMMKLDASRFGGKTAPLQTDKVLRIAIGVLGIALAPAVWFFAKMFTGTTLLPSVSDYYHTNSGDLFVSVLFFVGVFQMSYRGYQVIDDVYTWITGILAIGIGAFPCAPYKNLPIAFLDAIGSHIGIFQLPAEISGKIHFSMAIIFFILISFYVLVFFRRTDKLPEDRTKVKKRKDLVFTVCGYGMLLILLGLLIVYFTQGKEFFDHPGRVYFPEFALLSLFGFAWLVKSDAFPGLIDSR